MNRQNIGINAYLDFFGSLIETGDSYKNKSINSFVAKKNFSKERFKCLKSCPAATFGRGSPFPRLEKILILRIFEQDNKRCLSGRDFCARFVVSTTKTMIRLICRGLANLGSSCE